MQLINNPVKHEMRITSPFGMRNGKMHHGTDIAPLKQGVQGDELFAVADGWVEIAKANSNDPKAAVGYGWYVIICHDGGWRSVYAHQVKLEVKVGQLVKAGDVIGHMGNSGESTGVHLHFELRTGYGIETAVNAEPYLLKDKPVSPYRQAVQERYGFSDETMNYLCGYKQANALLQRLAETK